MPSHLFEVFSLIAFATVASGQCDPAWQPGSAVPGVDGSVLASVTWDPDGSGPATPLLVLAGSFTLAGSTPANQIAAYDPATGSWSTFGAGMDDEVRSLAVLPSGELVAGGLFSTADGVPVDRIAMWTGTTWSPLGSGVDGSVWAMAARPNGDLFVGGQFTIAGGQQAFHIARWDGSSWSPVGLGMSSVVQALGVMPNGNVIAGGQFLAAGGVLAPGLAQWNGNAWSPLGTGLGASSTPVYVDDVHVTASGELLVSGLFDTAGGLTSHGAARWNGTAWTSLGLDVSSRGYAVRELPNGDVVVAGAVQLPGQALQVGIARRAASGSWSVLADSSASNVQDLRLLPGGELVAGGAFGVIGGIAASGVAIWNTTAWSALDSGNNGLVIESKVLANGDLIVGGQFTEFGGVQANSIARWDGQVWRPLGAGVNGTVYSIEELPGGEIVVGGNFLSAGGALAQGVALWDGQSWQGLNGLASGFATLPIVFTLELLDNGDLLAGGLFSSIGGGSGDGLAVWSGGAWTPFPPLGLGVLFVADILQHSSGDIIVGGSFTVGSSPINSIARWDGTSWSPLGAGIAFDVYALAEMPDGDLVAGGWFAQAGAVTANNIARWNGSSWSAMGAGFDGTVRALQLLPDGDLVAAGRFENSGGVPTARISRWDGGTWNSLDQGCNGPVLSLALDQAGDLVAGGLFTVVGGGPGAPGASGTGSAYLARLRSPCPASAVATGSGCSGSAGPVELSAQSLPWLGGTFSSVATGMPNNALAVEVRGLGTTSTPLSSVLPQSAPGCTLLVTPDLLGLLVPSQGVATSAFAVPSSISLVGAVLHQQVAPLEFDLAGNILEATTSNALTLTIGAF